MTYLFGAERAQPIVAGKWPARKVYLERYLPKLNSKMELLRCGKPNNAEDCGQNCKAAEEDQRTGGKNGCLDGAVTGSSHNLSDELLESWHDFTGTIIWKFGKADLEEVFVYSLGRTDVVELGLDMVKLRGFHETIRCGYRANSYHNFYHAMQVFQGSYLAVTKYHCGSMLRPIDQLALLTGALCHDVDHPGVTNQFLKNMRHPLAILYDDVAVLERHHAAYTFRLLSHHPEIDFRQGLSSGMRGIFQRKLLMAVLATDMERSGEVAAHLKEVFKSRGLKRENNVEQKEMNAGSPGFLGFIRGCYNCFKPVVRKSATFGQTGRNKKLEYIHTDVIPKAFHSGATEYESDSDLFMCALLHCMDVSNTLCKSPVNKMWAALVAEEFTIQVNLEKTLSFPVSSSIDCTTEIQRANLQASFLEVLVLPRWRFLCRITGTFDDLLKQGEENCRIWKLQALSLSDSRLVIGGETTVSSIETSAGSNMAYDVDGNAENEQEAMQLISQPGRTWLRDIVGAPYLRRIELFDGREVL